MSGLVVERHGGIVEIVITNVARRNAMDERMWQQLHDIVSEMASSEEDRVLIVSGAGDSFCSGSDMKSPQRRVEGPETRMARANAAIRALIEVPKPTIAKVRGGAAGGGAQLALACDLVIASQDAYFWEMFIARRMSIDVGASWLLPRLVGLQRAKRMVLLGERVDAAAAFEMGLIAELTTSEGLDATVAARASLLCSYSSSVLAADKELLNHGVTRSLSEALDAEGRYQAVHEHALE